MKYISTRGGAPAADFEAVLLAGLAPDGGLYVPASLPRYPAERLQAMAGLDYPSLALELVAPFVGDSIERNRLAQAITESYAGFDHPQVAPVTPLGGRHHLLELYHGPTLAFKDFALQVLGRLLDHVLRRRERRVVILGATSGDTGSAAIDGCRHSERVEVVILHPHQRVSEVQRRQMTCAPGDNVLNLAVRGNFDDCQRLVKAAFAEQSFLPAGRQLAAVNSINWARIMMQVVYYFHAALRLGGPATPVSFSVPTGNFGDIYAGYLARGMGLPVERLIVATNANDILHRFISHNDYSAGTLRHTFSPSMDILVSSNFERYLFDLFDRDSGALATFLNPPPGAPRSVDPERARAVREAFASASADDETTCRVIAREHADTGILLDPHTAVGVHGARTRAPAGDHPVVTLATAHPAKFAEAITAAGLAPPPLPPRLADLLQRKERYSVIDNDLGQLKDRIAAHLQGRQ